MHPQSGVHRSLSGERDSRPLHPLLSASGAQQGPNQTQTSFRRRVGSKEDKENEKKNEEPAGDLEGSESPLIPGLTRSHSKLELELAALIDSAVKAGGKCE